MNRKWGGAALPAPPHIATKEELLQRLRQRPTPVPEQHLTPDNAVSVEVNNDIDNANEKRIEHLKSRLDEAHEILREGLSPSTESDGIKIDFERSN